MEINVSGGGAQHDERSSSIDGALPPAGIFDLMSVETEIAGQPSGGAGRVDVHRDGRIHAQIDVAGLGGDLGICARLLRKVCRDRSALGSGVDRIQGLFD